MRNFFFAFLLIDGALVLFTLLFANFRWLANSQVAAVGSALVILGTYHGYRKMVERRTATEEWSEDERDDLEKIDDPHGLYETEEVSENTEEVKKILAQEKARVKRIGTVKTLVSTGKGALSPFRLAGYAVLVAGFFFLLEKGMLQPLALLTGVATVPLAALLSTLREKGQAKGH